MTGSTWIWTIIEVLPIILIVTVIAKLSGSDEAIVGEEHLPTLFPTLRDVADLAGDTTADQQGDVRADVALTE